MMLKSIPTARRSMGMLAALAQAALLLFWGAQASAQESNRLQDIQVQSLPGQRVELTLARQQRLLELTVEVQAAIPDRYAVVIDGKPRRAEQRRLEAWLGRPLKFQ